MMLAVDPSARAVAEERWRAIGGPASAILSGGQEGHLIFAADDLGSADGRLVEQLADELEKNHSGSMHLSLSAIYERADIEAAELLLLEIGGLDDVLDPATVDSGRNCPACKRLLPPRLVGKPRLAGDALKTVDLFTAEAIVFVRRALADELTAFRGALLTEASAPANVGEFVAVNAVSSLGYPVEESWGPPCPQCGQRVGETKGRFVLGMYTFPREAWDGSDFVGTSFASNFLIVTQGPWKVLSDRRWRVAEGPIEARPVHLVDDAEPIR